MKGLLLLLILTITTQQSIAADIPYNGWWQKANKFYQEKNYDSAVTYYEKLAALHPDHAAVYYNLGNSYYKLNRIGYAVLSYERALKLNPDYQEAKDNLELTQSRISNRIQRSQDIFFVSWWKTVTKTSLAETWAVISLLLFLLILAGLLLRKWHAAPSWMRPQIIWLTALLCVCTLFIAYIASKRKTTHHRAVVMEQDTPLRDNLKTSKTQSLVPEGTVIKIESEQAGWVEVKLPDGRSGWMRTDALERI